MGLRGGYLAIGRWRGAPLRLHWTLPVGALLFGQGRFVPGFWLGFFLLVFVHELGHAVLVRRYGHGVVSIDIHALGGVCRWSGEPTAIDRSRIAWGACWRRPSRSSSPPPPSRWPARPKGCSPGSWRRAFTVTQRLVDGHQPDPGGAAGRGRGLEAARLAVPAPAGAPALVGGARGGRVRVRARGGHPGTLRRRARPEDVKAAVDDALQKLTRDPKQPLN